MSPPKPFYDDAKEIEASRWILDLKDDWDDEGSPAYAEATWQRVRDFLLSLSSDLPAPQILPGPKASIDVHWKTPRAEFLVNFPCDPSKPATFYGDDFADSCIRGNLDSSRAAATLEAWLLH